MGRHLRLALLLGIFAAASTADPGTAVPDPRGESVLEAAERASHGAPAPAVVPESAGAGITEVAVPAVRHDFAAELGAGNGKGDGTAGHENATGAHGWNLTPAGKNLLFYLGVFVVGIVLSLCLARPPPGARTTDPRATGRLSQSGRASERQPTLQK